MDFVVDTNVLFSYFREGSFVNKAIKSRIFGLYSPRLALDELNKYSGEICAKAGISKAKFRMLMEELNENVAIVPLEEYSSFFANAKRNAKPLRKEDFEEFLDDIDFASLALKLKAPVWSNDKVFKKLSGLRSVTTAEVIEMLKSE